MKKIDFEKTVDKINKIGKIIAFIGIVLSVAIKLNKMFGFWGAEKKATQTDDKKSTDGDKK